MSKLLIIGLDGSSLELISRWREELPCLSSLIGRGISGRLRSTVPHDTSPGWNALFTGKNPGKLNIFGFLNFCTDEDKANGTLRWANMTLQHGPSLWDLVGSAGLQVGVVNVPTNFPPRPVNGFMLCGGQLSVVGTRHGIAYPSSLQEEISTLVGGYETMPVVDFDIPDREDEVLAEMYRVQAKQIKAMEHLLASRPWDFATYVFSLTDGMHHYFWHHMDPEHPRHDPVKAKRYGGAIRDFYKEVDATIGRWLELVSTDTNILVVSDHGCGPLHGYFYPNEWLRQQGLLSLRADRSAARLAMKLVFLLEKLALSRLPTRLVEAIARRLPKALVQKFTLRQRWEDEANSLLAHIDWAKTRAFAIEGGIHLSHRGDDLDGGASEVLLNELAELLRQLPHPVREGPAASHVFRRDEIYWGPYSHHGADLYCFIDDSAYDPRTTVGGGKVWDSAPLSGGHRWHGLFIACGPDIKSTGDSVEGLQIYDIAPTALHLLGLPVPKEMDGRVLTEILATESAAGQRPVAYSEPTLVDTTRQGIRRLRARGIV